MTVPAIAIDQLCVARGKQTVLEGVSFTVEAGAYVSIIGPNGAGKTTLLKCLNRIVPARSGTITVSGRGLDQYSQRDLAKVLSYVPQADGRYFPFSVFEFVLMGRYPHFSPFSSISAEDKGIVRECLAVTGMAAFADRPINTLSGGERQSVFIAAALAQGAAILLLDEPSTFLDYKHQVEVGALLQRLNRDEGITIVTVTHDVTAALWPSDRVIALKAGRAVFEGTPEELLDGQVLEAVYETPMRFVHDARLPGPLVVPAGGLDDGGEGRGP